MSSPTYTFTGGVAPANYTPNSISSLGGAIGKIAEQVIRNVTANDRLAIFDKMPVENGDTIEQTIVKLASARAYDSTGANALTRTNPSIITKYFSDWTRATYPTTVDISEIRKILNTGKGVAEVSSKVVASLTEGEKFEKYTQTKNLLKWGRQDQTGQVLKLIETVNASATGIDYEKVLVALKDAVSGMQFVNSDFNTSSTNRSTRLEDIVILMPYKLKNRLSVEELAGVFNLSQTEIAGKIIELDIDAETISNKSTYPIYIVDRNAILCYMRLYEMVDQLNADGLFWNYFLHTDRLYGISPLFDAGYILVKAE